MKKNLKTQILEIIENGDDNYNNVIYLKKDGDLELYSGINFRAEINEYVARYETFMAGNGYVGVEASKTENYINELYRAFLKSWINYKENKMEEQYLGDFYSDETIEELEVHLGKL